MRQVLSVSRRTDIPAFYMPWFMDRVRRGSIEVINPFNRKVKTVTVSSDQVHTMVFWSKDFGPFLEGCCGERLQDMGYHLFFNFTVNADASVVEPQVPELSRWLNQMREICLRFGADSVQWRFDPICHFTDKTGAIKTNLRDFDAIAVVAGDCGIDTCITSFMDHYRKIERRAPSAVRFIEPSESEKVAILLGIEQTLNPLGIELALCCEKAVLKRLPAESTIRGSACISGKRIMAVHGGRVSTRQDTGQRKSSGCGCTQSIDVGSYDLHPCHHNCLYCYANPACDHRRRQ